MCTQLGCGDGVWYDISTIAVAFSDVLKVWTVDRNDGI